MTMDLETLIAEGERLARPTVLLTPVVSGNLAARWYGYDAYEVDDDDNFCIITVDERFHPLESERSNSLISLFVDEENCKGAYVSRTDSWPDRAGIALYAAVERIPAPLPAILRYGSSPIKAWLQDLDWPEDGSADTGLPRDRAADLYFSAYQNVHPLFRDDVYAALGGWHYPFPEGDWFELVDSHMSIMTIRDAEPWIEVWHRDPAEFDIIHRCT